VLYGLKDYSMGIHAVFQSIRFQTEELHLFPNSYAFGTSFQKKGAHPVKRDQSIVFN
jgi:hypothetical protein